ncbi:arabinosyltransferase domain-containing protein [Corynebacterium durum]|jgi:probable arabinosyltransferase, membrane protein|uniref:arabinosyltransferase domain-containing protein n=1 Tax=Corynebacterium durum TaxID=61592 RepID=UPI0040434C81
MPEKPSETAPRWVKRLAIVSGLLGFVLFVLTPFMPVNQTQSSFSWPQQNQLNSITAPLISYAPQSIEASIPLQSLQDMNPDQSMVLSTLPADSKDATTRGLFVRYSESGLDVVVRNKVPLELNREQINALPPGAVLQISSTEESTVASIPGARDSSGAEYRGELKGDERPQLTGIYTELANTPANTASLIDAGLNVQVEINSRFTSSPSIWKYMSMYGGLVMLVASLWALKRMDRLDGQGHRKVLPNGWFRPRLLDAIVIVVLVYWYIIGANTSDDGYLLTMARVADNATYMANYYRWFGVSEAPFGSPYYDLLALLTHVSTASVWMRLPEFVAGILTWWVISREVLPRMGEKINARKVAHWTAAFSFLGFWMVYNNGLRPEPVIALGALLTWVCMERAIATRRLLPAAVGVIIATVSLGAGPTGLMAVAALLAALSSLIKIVYRRLPLLDAGPEASRGAKIEGVLAMTAPFLASGTAILLAVFGDQTLATVRESTRVRSAIGPALSWYQEWARYQTLMQQTVDGSFTRRFAVLMMLLCLGLVLASVLRNRSVPGSDAGPSNRLMMVFFGTMFFMMFTPTKWTHHFGVYAGIGAALAALAAVAVSHMAMRSARNRTLFIGVILFVLAFSLSGTNGWWYISSFGIPWFDKSIQYRHIEASTVMLVIALLVLLAAAIQSFAGDVQTARAETEGTVQQLNAKRQRNQMKFAGVAAAPIAVVSAVVVVFSLLSLTKGFVTQYPAYSVGLGNLRALTGNTCALANDAMLETNSNESFLTPADGTPLGSSLEIGDNRGFDANNVPTSISAEGVDSGGEAAGSIAGSTDDDTSSGDAAGQSTGTSGGVRGDVGVNGSRARLPFGLDYTKVPVLGSYTDGPQFPAEVTTAWYQLPERNKNAPLLVVSAAGRIEHHDISGVHQDGQELAVEYGVRQPDGTVTDTGSVEPLDIGPAPSWRNLRVPMDQIPANANVVRVVASDTSLNPEQWLAFTPPRVPTLESLNTVIGSSNPGLLDWSVALQFPCQRTFDHYAGVTEIPEYRIAPDHPGKVTLSPWQDYNGGGALGVAEAINSSIEVPSYLRNDWGRDWGSIERYHLRTNSRGVAPTEAIIDYQEIHRSGLWTPGRMKIND